MWIFLMVAFHWLLFGTEEIQLSFLPLAVEVTEKGQLVGNLWVTCVHVCAQPLFSTLLEILNFFTLGQE
jgi:hypothetical protein